MASLPNLAFPPRPAAFGRFGYQVNGSVAELEAVAAGGGRFARFQPSWEGIEKPDGSYALSSTMQLALAACAKFEIAPILVHGYGPPRTKVAELTLSKGVKNGYKLPDVFTFPVTGDLSALIPRLDFVMRKGDFPVTLKSAYYGSIIESVDVAGGTITLGAHAEGIMKAGEVLEVRRLMYAPIFHEDPNDPSVQAYLRVVPWLAQQIAAAGCPEGYICLWNEDAWAHDLWNHGASFYDTTEEKQAGTKVTTPRPLPGGVEPVERMGAILKGAESLQIPEGVSLISGATDKSGASSVVWGKTYAPPNSDRPLGFEGMHDYGEYPEGHAWDPATFAELNPIADRGENFHLMAQHQAAAGTGLQVASTESGWQIPAPGAVNEYRQALWLARKVLSHWGMGVSVTSLYSLLASGFGVMTGKKAPYAPRSAYTVLQRLAARVAYLGAPGGSSTLLPVLTGCEAEYRVLTTGLYASERAALYAWQMSQGASEAGDLPWAQVAPPEDAAATFYLPPTVLVESCTFLVAGQPANYTLEPCSCGAAQKLTVSLGEDPVEIVTYA